MRTFLQDVADSIVKDYPDWENLTVVFPNRRAALYFRKALTENLTTPRWAPNVLSIEEFISSFSELKEADKLSLIVSLFRAFKKVTHSEENLDHFYFWGEMLLRDFDELDKYMVNAEGLFRDLSNQKELDDHFDYLTEEQKKFLQDFWQTVSFSDSDSKKSFLKLWQNLFGVYQEFKSNLLKDKKGFAGMIQREVAESFQGTSSRTNNQVVFAGFNALTTAEEKIITWFVQYQNAKVFWDEDQFYLKEEHREAGTFFREYRKQTILGNTFQETAPSLLDQPKEINILGIPQRAGQPKLLSQQLEEIISSKKNGQSIEIERTVIVLPDESLLLPVLYALPPALRAINVTMGYPLVNTPYYSLIDFLFELHLRKRKEEFYHRQVLAVLRHPYLKARLRDRGSAWIAEILKNNQVHIAPSFFKSNITADANPEVDEIIQSIFITIEPKDFLKYVLTIIQQLATSEAADGFMEKEFAFHFHRVLSRVDELNVSEPMELRMQQRMFRQIIRAEKVPFTGEPLEGLQIMGVLETRNLDFDHVIVLSLNEGLWPAAPRQGSYIPHTIRRAYKLPTSEHQDAMYAYLFYRLLQRAEKVDLYYNTEPDKLGTGEMSRYLYQIIYETGWKHERKILYNPVQVNQTEPITIEKKLDVLQKLERYFGKALTPSTLNTYIECRLKFYFRHLVELKEPEEVEEEADARIFGNIFHRVMELFYLDLKSPSGEWFIHENNFTDLDKKLEYYIERAFREHFHLADQKKMNYSGLQLVVKEMVKKLALHVLAKDKKYSPFTIEFLEVNNFNITLRVPQGDKKLTIVLGGKIDRADRKENTIRILDYKTGGDLNVFSSVESLFERNNDKRNKAVFQALLYALVYEKRNPELFTSSTKTKLQPGLINRKDIFRSDFEYGLYLNKQRLEDVSNLLPEFETHLTTLLEEIFNPDQPFDQTTVLKTCSYCSYKEICGR
ncbi:MAG TPA: PD-(D/E)XK nuclease family protein [Chryseolinea sp.]|mgnify:CR=1 FL=1|nr:PD-(D/E)XK nuclease family protein [Chryseolinea sp.]HPH46732.1 PD-(D/E)XK nuclease family protein [Chryseolinea sp.]HPM31371.1 PD-(D/E)XK nuclease family protein [Chryseolinea sp.]